MRRVESCAALAPLLSAQLRRGVVTNCFLSPADYQREIDAGLFYEEGDGFLMRKGTAFCCCCGSGPDTGS